MFVFLLFLAGVQSAAVTESFKNEYCTDPRTNRKHAAYTEWADAYSCTRHRCQPGGRNLAIYTVGCKRVEAPESAIECEEVVEDTNMQFPFCCTRLRCLVVVRGEVWTRVLGQPWESLPAAPWSHMYKMKKPPPTDGTFSPKTPDQGPIYELSESDVEGGAREKVLRSKQPSTEGPGYNKPVPRAVPRTVSHVAPPPDIVIALATDNDLKEKPLDMSVNMVSSGGSTRHKRVHGEVPKSSYIEEDKDHLEADGGDMDEQLQTTDKVLQSSDEIYGTAHKNHESNTEGTHLQWNEHDIGAEFESNKENLYNQKENSETEKPNNLQTLVNAIGSRMRDIESVVQRMSEKVQQPGEEETGDVTEEPSHYGKTKRPSNEDHYKRFSVRNRGSKYLHTSESTTDKPLFIEDGHLNGYFSDASNSLLRRSSGPKEPVQTYMAPVEPHHKSTNPSNMSDKKQHKLHQHKKKKGKHHKKHHSKKRFNRLSSAEVDKNMVSLEDSGELGA